MTDLDWRQVREKFWELQGEPSPRPEDLARLWAEYQERPDSGLCFELFMRAYFAAAPGVMEVLGAALSLSQRLDWDTEAYG